jgi:hypothetical protein
MNISRNMGTADRIVRALVGVGLVALLIGGALASPWTYLVGGLAAIMLATSAAGFCPLYALFGIRTCPLQRT